MGNQPVGSLVLLSILFFEVALNANMKMVFYNGTTLDIKDITPAVALTTLIYRSYYCVIA